MKEICFPQDVPHHDPYYPYYDRWYLIHRRSSRAVNHRWLYTSTQVTRFLERILPLLPDWGKEQEDLLSRANWKEFSQTLDTIRDEVIQSVPRFSSETVKQALILLMQELRLEEERPDYHFQFCDAYREEILTCARLLPHTTRSTE